MYYDYEDFYNEPSEFDQQVEEFKDALRQSVKDEFKQRIASLEKELESLKEFKNERHKFIHEYEAKIREAENKATAAIREAKESEEKWKKARLHQLLGDYMTVGWRPAYSWVYGEKCNKCDENRKIHFISPQGKEYQEDCECATRYYKYYPEEVTLCKMYVRKKNFHWDVKGKTDFYNRYYKVERKDDDDYDRYESANDIYEHGDTDFEKVNSWRVVFLNEEDCLKYCNWKTEQELKKKNG